MQPMELHTLRKMIAPVAARFGVKRVCAFGSYARGEATVLSDLDLHIEKGEIKTLLQLIGFRQALEDSIPLQIDIVTSDIADKEFIELIQKDEVILYEQ